MYKLYDNGTFMAVADDRDGFSTFIKAEERMRKKHRLIPAPVWHIEKVADVEHPRWTDMDWWKLVYKAAR